MSSLKRKQCTHFWYISFVAMRFKINLISIGGKAQEITGKVTLLE